MEYILLLLIIVLGVLLYLENRRNAELYRELKLSEGIKKNIMKSAVNEKLSKEDQKKQEKLRKSFNNMMDYGYETALNGHKEEE